MEQIPDVLKPLIQPDKNRAGKDWNLSLAMRFQGLNKLQ